MLLSSFADVSLSFTGPAGARAQASVAMAQPPAKQYFPVEGILAERGQGRKKEPLVKRANHTVRRAHGNHPEIEIERGRRLGGGAAARRGEGGDAARNKILFCAQVPHPRRP